MRVLPLVSLPLASLPLVAGCLPTPIIPGEIAACDDDARALPLAGTLLRDPRDARFRLAVLPELYGPHQLEAFSNDVAALQDELDHGALAALAGPSTFALDVFQPAPELLRADGRALASCLEEDPLGGPLPLWRVDLDEAWRHAPDADVVIVLLNHVGGRANAPLGESAVVESDSVITATRVHGRSIVMGRHDGWGVLTHELGHALFDLGDEYADTDRCFSAGLEFASPADLMTPNLTLDPLGARFAAFGVGAQEGGARHGRCVFHPDAPCLMKSSAAEGFCPVCTARIHEVLARHTSADTVPPRCQLLAVSDPSRIQSDVWSFGLLALDESGPVSALVTLGSRAVVRAVSDDARLAVGASLTAELLDETPATLTVQCADRLGNLSSATLEVARE